MDRLVIGSGLMLLGSGCGPVLSKEQREFLTTVEPGTFYPVEKLTDIITTAKAKKPQLVYATGRRWGMVVREEFVKRGIEDIQQAMLALGALYPEHHRGDCGRLIVEVEGPRVVVLTNESVYPHEMIVSVFESLAIALGAGDVIIEETGKKDQFRIQWEVQNG